MKVIHSQYRKIFLKKKYVIHNLTTKRKQLLTFWTLSLQMCFRRERTALLVSELSQTSPRPRPLHTTGTYLNPELSTQQLASAYLFLGWCIDVSGLTLNLYVNCLHKAIGTLSEWCNLFDSDCYNVLISVFSVTAVCVWWWKWIPVEPQDSFFQRTQISRTYRNGHPVNFISPACVIPKGFDYSLQIHIKSLQEWFATIEGFHGLEEKKENFPVIC